MYKSPALVAEEQIILETALNNLADEIPKTEFNSCRRTNNKRLKQMIETINKDREEWAKI